jgi:tetraacyldisaccharide 4'-kinase
MSLREHFYNLSADKEKRLPSGIIKAFLYVLSFLYGFTVRIIAFYYSLKPYRLDCRVISVGNITWGGTGKTPLVEYIARHLKQEGHRIAILSRGYKKRPQGHKATRSVFISHQTIGDEPAMLMNQLGGIPVIVDADRVRAAGEAIREYAAKAVILDDGFQQWRIKKDLEIVVIDAANPFGNRHMIPRGILREPLSALRRSHIFVLTKTNLTQNKESSIKELKEFLMSVNSGAEIFESIHKAAGFYRIPRKSEVLPIDVFKGKAAALISGIADPDSFEGLAKSIGLNAGLTFRFPDHYGYQKKDMEDIVRKSKERNIGLLITTEKDAMRIPFERCIQEIDFFVLKIQLKITDNEEEFINRIYNVFAD